MQLVPVDVGRGHQGLPVILVLQDDPSIDEACPQGSHDEVVGLTAVVDDVLQLDLTLLLHCLYDNISLGTVLKKDGNRRIHRKYYSP